MRLIKLYNHYYLLSDFEPKLFDVVYSPLIVESIWDGISFEITMLNSDLMALYPNEFAKVNSVIASTDVELNIHILNLQQCEQVSKLKSKDNSTQNLFTHTDMKKCFSRGISFGIASVKDKDTEAFKFSTLIKSLKDGFPKEWDIEIEKIKCSDEDGCYLSEQFGNKEECYRGCKILKPKLFNGHINIILK
jgi:hypothetical protein